MLEPNPDIRPDIFQVAHFAFQACKLPNPVLNTQVQYVIATQYSGSNVVWGNQIYHMYTANSSALCSFFPELIQCAESKHAVVACRRN